MTVEPITSGQLRVAFETLRNELTELRRRYESKLCVRCATGMWKSSVEDRLAKKLGRNRKRRKALQAEIDKLRAELESMKNANH